MSIYPACRIVIIFGQDDNGRTISRATGFLLKESNTLFLYTCWHVLSRFDPLQIPREYPERPTQLMISGIMSERRSPGVEVIGGTTSFTFRIYNDSGIPVWQQPGGFPDTGIGVPNFDCAKIDVSYYMSEFSFWFEDGDIIRDGSVGDDLFISGFPFGYSASEVGVSPIFLRRGKASDIPRQGGFCLLDGPGVKCMSGSPILRKHNGEWRICGMYIGSLFPESTFFPETLELERSQLPIGKYLPMDLVKAVLAQV